MGIVRTLLSPGVQECVEDHLPFTVGFGIHFRLVGWKYNTTVTPMFHSLTTARITCGRF